MILVVSDTSPIRALSHLGLLDLLEKLFLSGPEPAAPGPATCGEDSTDELLSECSYPPCT